MKSSMIEIAIGNPIKFEDGRIGWWTSDELEII